MRASQLVDARHAAVAGVRDDDLPPGAWVQRAPGSPEQVVRGLLLGTGLDPVEFDRFVWLLSQGAVATIAATREPIAAVSAFVSHALLTGYHAHRLEADPS
jgi:hypothetical protein